MMALAMTATALQAKTLVVYYSFTNNSRTIANDLKGQLADADLVEVLPEHSMMIFLQIYGTFRHASRPKSLTLQKYRRKTLAIQPQQSINIAPIPSRRAGEQPT